MPEGTAGSAPEAVGRARKGERRREEIVAAARRVLVHEGYDRFVMREIATRIGVTLGNLQYYFATRDDLLEAVVRAEFAGNQADVTAIAAWKKPARDRLAAIARHLIEVWAHEGGRIYAVMSLLALHHRRFRALHQEVYESFYDGLVPVLREMRPKESRASLLKLARLITTLIDGALVQVPSRSFVAEAVGAVMALVDEPPARWKQRASGR